MPKNTSQDRARSVTRISCEEFDIVVIGGGIGGACTAWDAAQRGMRVALLERADFGGSTSSQSLKVLHGGIRYLQHLDISRLRESCAERSAFLRIAPHLTRPIPFALPTYGHGMRGKLPLRGAFQLLNLFTSDRNHDIADRSQHIPSPFIMSRNQFLSKFPAFDAPGLTGAGVFYDGQMLNPARIVYAIVRSAAALGAVTLNYCEAEKALMDGDRVYGIGARDVLNGDRFEIRSKLVANMSGPYAPAFYKSGVATDGRPLDVPLSRDMAVVIDRKLLPDMGIGIQTKYRDPDAWLSRGNRHLFMAPWRDYTLIGVNSRIYAEDPRKLVVAESEIQGFIDEIQEACPALGVKREQVAVVNAGLLPFGENSPESKDLSFGKRSVLIDHAQSGGPQGLISGMSVRWTMGRLLAQKAVDMAVGKLNLTARPCATALSPVHGGDFPSRDGLLNIIKMQTGAAIPDASVAHLADTFGTLWDEVLSLPEGCSLLPDGKTLKSEVRYAARNEMAVTLADVVLRRLDLGTGSTMGEDMLAACAKITGEELGWSAEREQNEKLHVRQSYPFASPSSQEWRGA